MQYESLSLSNGIRIIHLPSNSPVSYCGFAINAGTRDEHTNQFGLAHFVEHMLFKGTKKRKPWHILNRMENVGGELNAYTTKEETFLYTVCLSDDVERAIELLSDLVFNSLFTETEINKERKVIIDEINSYRDNPSELIFDEFENQLFKGNDIGHNILGDEKSLNTFTSQSFHEFVNRLYLPENLVFFSYGKTPFSKITRLANKYMLHDKHYPTLSLNRKAPEQITTQQKRKNKKLHQTHVIVGSRGYSLFNEKRIGLYFLNNILGGPGMNSRLNISLREKHGLVYTVESGLTTYTDTGVFSIYFGCDPESRDKCLELTYKELKKLRETKLTTQQLSSATKQLKGQMGIASDNSENIALSMGKSFLHLNRYDTLQQVYQKIDTLTAEQLLEIANEVLDENGLFRLEYQ